MKLKAKQFPKSIIDKHSVLRKDTNSKISREWNPDITAKGKKEVIESIKNLLKGLVIYFRKALMPVAWPGSGVAYLIPKKVFWGGACPYITGDIVYFSKEKGSAKILRTTETNHIVPDLIVQTVSFAEFRSEFAKMAKSVIPGKSTL